MSLKLIKQALAGKRPFPRMWHQHEMQESYDVVIIGGGGHGLACAYYLAKDHDITNVAILEKNYIGSGGSGRNTAIVRSNYLTPAGVRFYDESLKLFEGMAVEFDFNVMLSQRKGHLTLAHSDGAMRTMRRRAEVNLLEGVESSVIGTEKIKKLCPSIDVSDHPRLPIHGALFHPRGGIMRHDAVVWGYAHHADRMGVHIHQLTAATDIDVQHGKVVGVQTNRGPIKTGMVLNATAGWSSIIAAMAGVKLPITTFPLQALVTEPLKPFLDVVIVSGSLHTYISQSGRGELVMGAAVDPYASYSMRGSLGFTEGIAGHMLEQFPSLGNVRVMRQWAGLCDMTPDYSQIMGFTPVEGFVVDGGWGTYGFKATPASGKRMAELIATNETPEMIRPFRLSRFYENDPVGEKGAASVGK